MEHVLGTEEFILRISTEVFETDIKYPCNTSLKVAVESCGFCGKAVMDIDIKEFAKFTTDLYQIYQTLSGEARISEVYGTQMYILFVGNGRGHITVRGRVCELNRMGNEQSLEFENDIDQTSLKEFCYDLWNGYKVYLPK